MRKNIRKCTYDEDKKIELKRAKSERKMIVLKLKDDEHEENNAEAKDNKDVCKVEKSEPTNDKKIAI